VMDQFLLTQMRHIHAAVSSKAKGPVSRAFMISQEACSYSF
jgi:hypothetical protein